MKMSSKIVAAVTAGLLGFGGVAVAIPNGFTRSMTLTDVIARGSVSSASTTEGGKQVSVSSVSADLNDPTTEKYADALDLADAFDPTSIQNTNDETAVFAILEKNAGMEEGVDAADCAEVAPLALTKVKDWDGGPLQFRMKTLTKYRVGDYVAVLVQVVVDDATINYVVTGQVTEDDTVTFTVNGDIAQQLLDGTGFYAVYSASDSLQ